MMSTFQSNVLFANIVEDFWAAVLEYVGTTVFLLLGFGGLQATQGEVQSGGNDSPTGVESIMYKSLTMGCSLLISAWLFFRVTGALFNPNISLALLLTGVIGPVRFVFFCIAQLLGGITAAALVLALTPGPLAFNVVLAPGINAAQGVFIEMLTTAILVLAVLMLAAEKHFTTPFAPVGIGLTLFACSLFALYYTGAALNTARAFGPAVVSGFPHSTHWVWWVGPCLGSFLGASLYTTLKHYRYWRLSPGQDTIDYRASPPDPVDNVKSVVVRTGSRASGGSGRQKMGMAADVRIQSARTNDSAGAEKMAKESDANPV
ncbi:putative aquaporin 1 [Obba rivulosa]|uniref:Putative aquaporin 1 n=1 Tax=Obba rivulosa TaxID=1052685 RepID=A0A8E2DLE8_9APHY|nr:putative aquaporin 1 [Obba rivulosa]